MSLPRPLPGLVIRYRYLWAEDADHGLLEADKERPAAVVMVVEAPSGAETRVYVLPITHSSPTKEVEAIEMPAAVRRAAGLDARRTWVILTEFNEFIWPGFDLSELPGRKPATIAYGFLTADFFETVRERWLELDAEGKSDSVARD